MHLRTKLSRCLPAALVLALAAITLAGCSTKEAEAGAAETLRRASSNTASADSVRFEMAINVSGIMGEALTMDAQGEYDLEAGRMHMSMDAIGQQIEAVMDGKTMYMKMALLGDGWFKTELEGQDASGNPLSAGLENPTKILAWLQAASDDVTHVGTEEIRGQQTDHYRTTLDLREATEQLDGDAREEVEKAIELLGQSEFPVDVWVNKDGLPARLAYEMTFGDSAEALLQDASFTYTMEFFDWGKPVSVAVPDPTEVTDLEDAMGIFGG